ncbi:hypothetical protein LMH87_011136 [Akanthomyces muscarius]|uniref:Uncharacterized protein n=1 Tax=Akanthomyces muscarius TaxID=2231603 RepID=A0A9W8Q9D6_AKAMU|nr:hypothetical protein LMH87_011136 [Akanthomyces muscarius]KAJ4150384.1 hypothetical protein LMH87_011136 [Akanthomyces muscarius]
MSSYRNWTKPVMDTPRNCIEDFGPEEFPMRTPRDHTEEDIAHILSLSQLTEVRRELSRYGSDSSDVVGPLNKVLQIYTISAKAFLSQAETFRQIALRGIDDSFIAQKTQIAATHRCCFSLSVMKARRNAATAKKALIAATDTLFAKCHGDILEAMELMHRQLAMNAFLTSELSWSADRFVINGARQGCLASDDIHAYQLIKHFTPVIDDYIHNDGRYSLRLQWIPFAGATKYPESLSINRTSEESFDVEDIHWTVYERAGNELDLHPRFQPKTVPITVTIRCNLVQEEQSWDRIIMERDEMAEKKYKKSLPILKKLTYKAGDHRKAPESVSRRALTLWERATIERDEVAEKAYKSSIPFWKKLTYTAGDHREALALASNIPPFRPHTNRI